MGQKSKKKSGNGSASKLKKLEARTPIVALPAANEDEGNTSAAAMSSGEAVVGKNEVLGQNPGLEKADSQATVTTSPSNLKVAEPNIAIGVDNPAPMNTANAGPTGDGNRNSGNAIDAAKVASAPISSNPNVLKAISSQPVVEIGSRDSLDISSTEKVTPLVANAVEQPISVEDTHNESVVPVDSTLSKGKNVVSDELAHVISVANVLASGNVVPPPISPPLFMFTTLLLISSEFQFMTPTH